VSRSPRTRASDDTKGYHPKWEVAFISKTQQRGPGNRGYTAKETTVTSPCYIVKLWSGVLFYISLLLSQLTYVRAGKSSELFTVLFLFLAHEQFGTCGQVSTY
jgi:hypothetical protein